MSGNLRWGLALAAAMVAVVAGGQLLPSDMRATAAPEPVQGQLQEQTVVCPMLSMTSDSAESVATFALPPVQEATGSISQEGAGNVPLPAGGGAVVTGPLTDRAEVQVTATGESVASTATVRQYFDPGDEGRGLAIADCVPARSQWWFPGVSAIGGRIDELLMSNPTSSPAVVTLRVLGPAGPIELAGTGGLVVQPHSQASVRVDSLAPGTSNATLQVATNGGLVAASVRSTNIDGLIPLGAEYLPAAAPPSTRVVVPGIVAGAGTRNLVITAAESDAAVSVRLLTGKGPLDFREGAQIPIPAGHTIAMDLAEQLDGAFGAAVVTATGPVTAAVASTVEGTLPPDATGVLARRPVAETATSVGQAAITGLWRLPLTGVAAAPAVVSLSSLGGTVQADLSIVAANGATWQGSVEVPADSAVQVPVPVTDGSPAVITVTRGTGSGELHAAVVQQGSLPSGPIVASAVGFDPSTVVRIPFAYPDPAALMAD